MNVDKHVFNLKHVRIATPNAPSRMKCRDLCPCSVLFIFHQDGVLMM